MTDNERQLFENLAIEHMDNLYSKAIRLARSSEGAEELVQRTYATAFNQFEQFDKGRNFCHWLDEILMLICASLSEMKLENYDTR